MAINKRKTIADQTKPKGNDSNQDQQERMNIDRSVEGREDVENNKVSVGTTYKNIEMQLEKEGDKEGEMDNANLPTPNF